MSKEDKKRRHNAKREAKRQQARRRDSVSPMKRLADAPGEVECWISEGFETMRQASCYVYKRAAGLAAMASFLIDAGVVGLKDAWTRMNAERADIDDVLKRSVSSGMKIRRASVEEVRAIIAAGARWAHDNGMRLPKDWLKTASLIGGVGDWKSADVSGFDKEFAGHPEDLRQRLIGEPFDSYVKRRDIRFIFNDDVVYMDQETGDYIDPVDDDDERVANEVDEMMADAEKFPADLRDAVSERFIRCANEASGETAQWLTSMDRSPSPELAEAWKSLMFAVPMVKFSDPSASTDAANIHLASVMRYFADSLEEDRRPEYLVAVKQVEEHIQADRDVLMRVIFATFNKRPQREDVEAIPVEQQRLIDPS